MRWFYLAIVVIFVLAILIFVIQNTQIVDISFLGMGVSAPLALIVVAVYVLGALTGGSLYALLRMSLQGSRAGPN